MFDISMTGQKHLVLDRRKFLGIAAGLIAAGVLPKNVLALAGPYSFKQGAYDVTVVSDGTLLLPLSLVGPDAKPEDVKALLGAIVQGDNAHFEASPLLLRSGSDVILMDTGSGSGFQPTRWKNRRQPQIRRHRSQRHYQSDFHPRPPRPLLGHIGRRWQAHIRQRFVPHGRNRMEFLDSTGSRQQNAEGDGRHGENHAGPACGLQG